MVVAENLFEAVLGDLFWVALIAVFDLSEGSIMAGLSRNDEVFHRPLWVERFLKNAKVEPRRDISLNCCLFVVVHCFLALARLAVLNGQVVVGYGRVRLFPQVCGFSHVPLKPKFPPKEMIPHLADGIAVTLIVQ